MIVTLEARRYLYFERLPSLAERLPRRIAGTSLNIILNKNYVRGNSKLRLKIKIL
jgi:hypothetical protein